MQQALPNISTQKDIAVMQPHSTQNMVCNQT